MERDYSTSAIFRRDNSGDHVLLSRFRDRVSVPENSPGDVTLQIKSLEIPDSGHYTCQVTWRSKNNSLITKEVTTIVKVVKVAVTKPIIRAGELGLMVPAGARTSLTCVATGSPPISYRWFLGEPGGKARLLGSQAELTFDSLRPSDSGKYYCEAENRVGARVAQQSDAVELTVRELPAATPTSGKDVVSVGPPTPIATGLQWGSLLPYLIVLAAGLCGAALVAVAVAIARRGKTRDEALYEVAFHSTVDVMRTETGLEVPAKGLQEEENSRTEASYEILTMKDNDYSNICTGKNTECDTLLKAMESEYEVENF
ncbi:V-set and immunoglobulin domain-containing protein 4 isoform X2 [Struthio camelus]